MIANRYIIKANAPWIVCTRYTDQKWTLSGGHLGHIISSTFPYLLRINNCSCLRIYDTIWIYLSMLTYIYLKVDECWLTSSMHQQRFKLHMSFNYAVIWEKTVYESSWNCWSELVPCHSCTNLMINAINAWVDKDYRLPGVHMKSR